MAPATVGSGHRIATSTQGGFALVSTYSWMTITFAIVVARFAQGIIMRKAEMGIDDMAILIASIFYLGTTISWQYTIDGGLGKNMADLSPDQVTLLFKASYIAGVLGIAAIVFAKLSSACLIDRVAPQTTRAKAILFSVIGSWAIFALFIAAFECGLPRWTAQSLQCRHRGPYIAVIITNIITDFILAGWIVPTVWNLALERDLRVMATVLFGVRGLVPLVTGVQLWAVIQMSQSSNPSHDFINVVVLTQAVTSLSIIVASVPRIKRCLAIGGSPLAVAEVQANEIPITRGSVAHPSATATTEPKLVPPSSSALFTATITSKNSKSSNAKRKTQSRPPEWQGMVSMGSKEDEHTSQSSLCEHDDLGGVVLQREVMVSMENRGKRRGH